MPTSEAKTKVGNAQNSGGTAEREKAPRLSKSHQDYWKTKIRKASYTRDGKRIELPEYAVRIQHGNSRQVYFPLHTANAATAAEKARKIYLRVVGAGWAAALAEFKPKAEAKVTVATVGEFIAAVEKVATVRPNSLHAYTYALRRLAADLTGLGTLNAKSAAYATAEFKGWRAKVDAVSLSKVTPERVEAWRAQRIASKKNPVERDSAKVSSDSAIRNARALFSERVLSKLGDSVKLPTPLPLAGVKVGKTTKRFSADVSAETLFAAAVKELRDGDNPQPEAWKAFVLCLLCGLRKREADTLTRAQLRPDEARIVVARTAHFEPKSDEAAREIALSPEAVAMVRQILAETNPDPTFVLRGGAAKPLAPYEFYRADVSPWETWLKLARWLRSKGVKGHKPIHGLRKLAGSLIHAQFGIEAARDFLGHADISTTSASYLSRQRVAVSFAAIAPKGATP